MGETNPAPDKNKVCGIHANSLAPKGLTTWVCFPVLRQGKLSLSPKGLSTNLVNMTMNKEPSALDALGVEVYKYRIPSDDIFSQITIEERIQPLGKPSLWAVKRQSNVLNKHGDWEHEALPSSRDEEFITRCRFESAEHAAQALLDYLRSVSTQGFK
jgi:hypothetical protein